MAHVIERALSQAIEERRATPSFDGRPIPPNDLRKILEAGLEAPSGYNLQPWRFVVVRTPEQRRRLRSACFNQAKVEEASAVIVACGDADGWRNGDLEEVLRMGCEGGMIENYAEQARSSAMNYLENHPNLVAWLNRQVMVAFTSMMLMAEALGYDTACVEGVEEQKVRDVLNLPASYQVVSMLALGQLLGEDKFYGGRFNMAHTVFSEEYGKPLEIEPEPEQA